VAGESLQARLDRQGPLALREILRIAYQTAAGLAAAHAQGLVHRDVKPSNILLEEGIERALLTDFGLARAADDASLTHTGYLPGTPHYMSPEQARGETVEATSDLFSLGSVIYAMCTARPPFRADTSFGVLRRITDTEPRAIREINPDIPAWLAVLVQKLLAKRPGERFATAAEAATTLEQCLAHVQQPGAVALPAVCRVRPMRGRVGAWMVGVVACLVVVGLVASYFGMFGGPSDEVNRRGSLRDAQQLQSGGDSSSLQLWDATEQDIQSLSSDAEALERKTGQLWDRQPVTFPKESEQESMP
jgi:serine/threonine-protein kinase